MGIKYSQPTLFGIAYASRLFREIDGNPGSYETLMKTAPTLDLGNEHHAFALLRWLNKWGCRIAKNRFPALSSQLKKWFEEQELPPADTRLAELEDPDFQQLVRAYESLRNCGLGPTTAAKTLFAVRPKFAIPWDKPIRAEFKILQDDSSAYRAILQLSHQEANTLITDANRYEIHTDVDILNAVGSTAYGTVAKLLDEYHWITITGGYQIPCVDELERWVSWHPRRAVQ